MSKTNPAVPIATGTRSIRRGPSTAFARFTDPEVMEPILRERLSPWFDRQEGSGSRSSLSVCYRLSVTGRETRDRDVLLYVKAYSDGRSRNEWDKVRPPHNTGPRAVRAVIHLPELDAIAWRFPHDPALPHLAEVMDPDRVRVHVPWELLPDRVPGPNLTVLSTTVAHYRPETRCTTRYDLRWNEARALDGLTLYGKTFKGEEGRAIYTRMQRLAQISREDPHSLRVPQPLAYTDVVKTIWQHAIDGPPLVQVIDTRNYQRYLDRVAKGLATIHKSDLSGSTATTTADHLADSRKKSLKLAQAFPALVRPLHALVRQLESGIPEPSRSDTLIHGDFQIRQLLTQGDDVVFLDFDECADGDPAQDLANFVVSLHFHDFSARLVDAMSAALVASYRRVVDANLSPHRLDWHARVQFLNKAYRAYLWHRPGVEQEVRRIINLAAGPTPFSARKCS